MCRGVHQQRLWKRPAVFLNIPATGVDQPLLVSKSLYDALSEDCLLQICTCYTIAYTITSLMLIDYMHYTTTSLVVAVKLLLSPAATGVAPDSW
jgi:hypothetical protein